MAKELDEKQIGNSLQRVVSMLDPETIKKGDFIKNFKRVIDYVKKIEKKNLEDLKSMSEALTKAQNNAKNTSSSDFKALKESINVLTEKSNTGLNKALESKINEINKRISEIKNGKDGISADENAIAEKMVAMIKIPTIDELKNDLPIMGEQVRNALELLEGDERLTVESIDGLKESLEGIDKRMTGIYQQGSSSSGGKNVKYIDLSSQLNGSKRVFAIQNVWRIVSIHLTSNPTIMREGVDFNWSAKNSTLTFTSEVSDISLSSGQTLMVLVAE